MANEAAHEPQYPAFDTLVRGYVITGSSVEVAEPVAKWADALRADAMVMEAATKLRYAAELADSTQQQASVFKNPEAAKNVLAAIIGIGTVVLFGLSLFANHALK